MKKIYLILLSFFLGVLLTSLFVINLTTFNFAKLNAFAENKTRPISEEKQKKFKEAFNNKIKNAVVNPVNWNTKLIGWPKELGGWVVDADLLQNVLLNQGGETRDLDVNNIYLELGYNEENSGFTIMLTGLKEISESGAEIKTYKKINRTAQVNNTSIESNILEYVNPCRPHCPE